MAVDSPIQAAKKEVIHAARSDRTSPPSLALGSGNTALRGSNGEGWSGGGIAVSDSAFFLRLMVDQLIPTELMFRIEELMLELRRAFPKERLSQGRHSWNLA